MQPGKAVPVYRGFPERSYEVIGYLECEVAPIRKPGLINFAAEEAKKRGAEAVVVVEQGQRYVGQVGGGEANTTFNQNTAQTSFSTHSTPLFSGTAKVLLVKFRDGVPASVSQTRNGQPSDDQPKKLPVHSDPQLDLRLANAVQTEITSDPIGVRIKVNGTDVGRTPLIYIFRQDGGHHFVGDATVKAVTTEPGQFEQTRSFLDPSFPSFAPSDRVPSRIVFDMKNQVPEPDRKAKAFRFKATQEPK